MYKRQGFVSSIPAAIINGLILIVFAFGICYLTNYSVRHIESVVVATATAEAEAIKVVVRCCVLPAPPEEERRTIWFGRNKENFEKDFISGRWSYLDSWRFVEVAVTS